MSGDTGHTPGRLTLREAFDALYHVPRSQVWPGSRGRQSGLIHLHVKSGEAFEAGRLRRIQHQSLCGRRGWYERPTEDTEPTPRLCERCVMIGVRESGRLYELVSGEVER